MARPPRRDAPTRTDTALEPEPAVTTAPSTPASAVQPETVARLAALLRNASVGMLSGRITDVAPDDPLAEVVEAANDLLDRVETSNREVLGAMGAALEGRYHRRYVRRGMNGSFVTVATVVSNALEHLAKQEKVILGARSSISGLAQQLRVEVGARTQALAASSEELSRTSVGVVSASRTCSAMSDAGVKTAREALSGSEQIAAATEELAASIREIGNQSHQSKVVSERAVQEVLRAQQVMADVTTAAAAVNSIIGVISEIARQTNLLALNAAIEAARAGDAGRGFGVVAAEVKELASQTRDSTQDISVRIAGVGEAVTRGSRAVEDISAALEQLVAFVNNISSAIYEQDTVTTEIANGAARGVSFARNVVDTFNTIDQAVSALDESARHLDGVSESVSARVVEVDGKVRDTIEKIEDNVKAIETGARS